MSRTYGVDDLARATVTAAEFAGKHPDLAGYYASRLRALEASFGIGTGPVTSSDAQRHRNASALKALRDATIASLRALTSPFDVFLEAPPIIFEYHRRFSPAVSDELGKARKVLFTLLTDILVELHGIPADRTVDDDDLRRHGFDPTTSAPELYEYD